MIVHLRFQSLTKNFFQNKVIKTHVLNINLENYKLGKRTSLSNIVVVIQITQVRNMNGNPGSTRRVSSEDWMTSRGDGNRFSQKDVRERHNKKTKCKYTDPCPSSFIFLTRWKKVKLEISFPTHIYLITLSSLCQLCWNLHLKSETQTYEECIKGKWEKKTTRKHRSDDTLKVNTDNTYDRQWTLKVRGQKTKT